MQINSMTPSSGPPLTPCHINGSGFMSTTNPTYTLTVNGVQSSPISVLSDTDLDFCIPQTATTGTVTLSDGTNTANAPTPFTIVGNDNAGEPFEPILDSAGGAATEDV